MRGVGRASRERRELIGRDGVDAEFDGSRAMTRRGSSSYDAKFKWMVCQAIDTHLSSWKILFSSSTLT